MGETASPPGRGAPPAGRTDTSGPEPGNLRRNQKQAGEGRGMLTFQPMRFQRGGLQLTFRDPPGKDGRGLNDLMVLLKRDVTTDHVKEQDAKRPDSEGDGLVGPGLDPLRGAVDPRAWGEEEER